MLGLHSPHGVDMGMPAAHPAADTILRAPQAAVIGVATVAAMVMAGAVVQLAAPIVAGAATATVVAGDLLRPAVTTTTPAVAAVVIITTGLLPPAEAIGRRAALQAAGTRIFG